MRRLRLLASLALASAILPAQSPDALEIRGSVRDPFLGNIGVPGASVTLTEYSMVNNAESRIPVAAASTDTQGSFLFHPDHFGRYLVEVHREGYVIVSANSFGDPSAESLQTGTTLDSKHPSQEMAFAMTRPGELTGRVVDEEGRPVPNLHLAVQTKSTTILFGKPVITDKDGNFTAPKLPPGEYFVRILPALVGSLMVSKFSAEEFKGIDQDFEASYWPGGSAEPQSTIVLGSGGQASVGVIKARKLSYYRVHVSLEDDCTAGPNWKLVALNAAPVVPDIFVFTPAADFACQKEFVVRNVKPGSYQFAFSNEQYGSAARWAMVPVQVTRANLEIKLALSPPGDIQGRIVTVDNAPLPPLAPLKLRNSPALSGLMEESQVASPDAEGKFAFRNLPWSSQRIQVEGLSPSYYIKEMRAGGAPLQDRIIPLVPGAPQLMEIVVDDQAATLTGSVMDGDKPVSQAAVMLIRSGGSGAGMAALSGNDGTFRVGGLAPGEYQVIALPPSARARLIDRDIVNRLLPTAPSVRLERGGSASLILKLADPSR